MDNQRLVLPMLGVAAAGTVAALLLLRGAKKQSPKGPPPAAAPAKLTIYGFLPLHPDADGSPPCLKLETFLKMCRVDFDTVYFPEHGMKSSPKGKVPWMHWEKVNDGNPMGDSTLIANALVRSDPSAFDLDAHLTAEQRAIGAAFKTMLEESTYWNAIIHVRWNTAEFDRVTVPTYFGSVPTWIRGLIARRIARGKVMRDARGQGSALLDDAEVVEKFGMELDALSDYLGDKKYFMGDRLSSYDATVFGYVACFVQGNWRHEICDTARGCENLMRYVERMRDEFWSELKE